MTHPSADDVIEFWFAPSSEKRWFASTPEFDADLEQRFGAACARALAGELDDWTETPRGALGLILLLDQIQRNLGRGSADAYAGDAKALAIAEAALERNLDEQLDPNARKFLYMPFMHAEDLASLDRCVALFESLGEPQGIEAAIEHREIIARFGRYPHRNRALGRASTDDELAYLDNGARRFGQ